MFVSRQGSIILLLISAGTSGFQTSRAAQSPAPREYWVLLAYRVLMVVLILAAQGRLTLVLFYPVSVFLSLPAWLVPRLVLVPGG